MRRIGDAFEPPTRTPRELLTGLEQAGGRLYGVFDRLPIRTRLAVASALLTFTILCVFAVVVGSLTVHRIRSDFDREAAISATNLAVLLNVDVEGSNSQGYRLRVVSPPNLDQFARPEHAVIRILTAASGNVIDQTRGAPPFRVFANDVAEHGYLVYSRLVQLQSSIGGAIIVQYGRPLAEVNASVARVELFLVLGVFGGTALALLAGIAIARRAMAPIAALTRTADEIARTRDPSRSVPEPAAEDEVAELAHTLGGMLRELDVAHAETEAMLERQRRFVADASHELRTPLTSVLANLELLAESLRGDEADAARSALRSSQRMRRLVGDLLLLARTDVGRVVPRQRCDLAEIAVEAAGELGPVSSQHDIALEVAPAPVEVSRDEVHRVAINLIENALRHTPPGTEIRVRTFATPAGARLASGGGAHLNGADTPGEGGDASPKGAAGHAVLVVEDDGPGVPEQLAATLFERFVRGAGDRGGSFGLGLAIVRAVAESHGGSVTLSPTHPGAERPGARFIVTLPLAPLDLDDDREHHGTAAQAVVDQLR